MAAGIILGINVIVDFLNDQREERDQFLDILGLLIAGGGGYVMITRLITASDQGDTLAFIGLPSIASAVMMVVLLVIDLRYSKKPFDAIIGVGTHILALIWLAAQVRDFEYSLGLISAMWAIYAIGLLIAGMVFNRSLMRQLGIGTILLTIAKLFLVDLENVSTGLRVILFSGFGAVLLGISYFARNLWRKPEEEREQEEMAVAADQ